jgi:hypothetical protein
VILVSHSYGGVVITEAGTDPKVAGLVYIAAFVPDRGESAASLIKDPPSARLCRHFCLRGRASSFSTRQNVMRPSRPT